ncbi:MAG: glucosaminidase domain-containing protein [Hespellia sp.]|nr:glucosaminidase domain-containing protein [Hespellia sp.]
MKHKGKIYLGILLSTVMLAGSFGSNEIVTYATDAAEVSVETLDTETAEPEVTTVDKSEETPIEENRAEGAEDVVISVDEDGNIQEVPEKNGTVEGEATATYGIERATQQLVNFNTRGNAVTTYTEYLTGASGYTNGMCGADAAYLGTENGMVKFMLSGVIGLVDPASVQVLSLDTAQSMSYYQVSGGRLYHYISTDMSTPGTASTIDNGLAPPYLAEGVQYYSYDGHFFYINSAFNQMLSDYNASTRTHSVNAENPFYNYFQYLPLRSQTNYTAEQLNAFISSKAASSTSKMLKTASTFISNQNTYGVNALLAIGVAANESWWGKSNIAQQKNNLFGLNAVDSSPGESADAYASVNDCIKAFTETYMSKRYLNPNNSVNAGAYLGNKASGITVSYASNPYWGEINASVAWQIDKTYGSQDAYKYTIGIKDVIGTEHTNLNVRNAASTASTVIYRTKSYSNQAFIILDSTAQSGFYKVQSDPVLTGDRSAVSGSGNYDFVNMYAYASSDYVRIVSNGNGNGTIPSNPGVEVPAGLQSAIQYQAHVQDLGWMDSVTNGNIMGTTGRNLPVEAMKIQVNGIDNLGVSYRAHVQDIGWQDSVVDGTVSGTEGQAKKIEAVQIQLTGEKSSEYDIYYRVHVSEFGWMDWAKNGQLAGTQGYNYAVQAIQIALLPKGNAAPGVTEISFRANTFAVSYSTHVQDIGWQDYVSNGVVAGTTGQNKKVEGLKINTTNNLGIGLKYRAYLQDLGWQDYMTDDNIAGTVGQNRRMEAVQIELNGAAAANYSIYYRVHVQDLGWLGWTADGNTAGTINYGLKIEALQVMVMPKGIPDMDPSIEPFYGKTDILQYSAHVETVGWQNYVKSGETAGTTGQNKQVEALKIKIKDASYSGSIQYSSYVEGIGWQDYVSDDSISGTTGRDKQIEAIKVKLTQEMAKQFNIYYRVHASEFGWLSWTEDGEPAGSEGYGRQIEALQIMLVRKGDSAPDTSGAAFYKKNARVEYAAHVADIGWQPSVSDGATAGTTGQNKQVEALTVTLKDLDVQGSVKYCAHVADIGWQDYVVNGNIAGTVGSNKQVEALKIELTGKMNEKYDIYYRVHSSEFGWLGWAKNGDPAGSQGYGRQVEAFEIRLVRKNNPAPGSEDNSFYKK